MKENEHIKFNSRSAKIMDVTGKILWRKVVENLDLICSQWRGRFCEDVIYSGLF
jgi:hypothetical protein